MSDRFHELLQQAGARWGAYLGAPSTLDYGDPNGEYETLRSSTGLVECSARTQVELTGNDRAKFLHNLCTNEIRKLVSGQGCEALLLDARGHIQFHALVYAGDESLVLDTVPGQAERLLGHLDRYLIREQVVLHDRSADWAELLIAGHSAQQTLEHAFAAVIEEPLTPHRHRTLMLSGSPVSVRNLGDALTDASAWRLSLPRTQLAAIWQTLVAAGARPCGAAAYDTCRIEARWPDWGVDISDKNLPQELGRDAQLISFVKGCYIGQETVARIDALGHVNRLLVRLAVMSDKPPAVGTEVSLDGVAVGHVTSVSAFQTLLDESTAAFAALAYVRRGSHETGQVLSCDGAMARVLK